MIHRMREMHFPHLLQILVDFRDMLNFRKACLGLGLEAHFLGMPWNLNKLCMICKFFFLIVLINTMSAFCFLYYFTFYHHMEYFILTFHVTKILHSKNSYIVFCIL